ncbi:MAG TPA: methyltransferase domain-containing protein [Thermoanaerobaculia bacterium]|nr:methyltransferase domain-containing protein [Thermoanaerobaculia bacterium]
MTTLGGVLDRVRRLVRTSPQAPPAGGLALPGRCNICGERTLFAYTDPALYREELLCGGCRATSRYRSIARGLLDAFERLAGVRAACLARLPRRAEHRIAVYDTQIPFDNGASAYPIPWRLEEAPWIDLCLSTYRKSEPEGAVLAPDSLARLRLRRAGATNQNLERLTFADASFDVVVTSDVMEHVRRDDLAHREIRRVLRPGGFYVFTVPHFRDRETLVRVRVADPLDPSKDVDELPREYHGDANSEDGRSLAYRGYGTDLDATLGRLGFDVAYTKDDFPELGILNTELFLCRVVREAATN